MWKSVTIAWAIVTLFSCEGNYQKVQQLNIKDDAPVTEGQHIKMVYTDSGKVVTNLMADKVLDFSNMEFSYQEFPEGIEVHFFDQTGKSTVTSDFARRYPTSGIVDLRENVVLVTADGNVLEAQQLYWDQVNKWVFTDRPYRINFSDGSFNDGGRFDANEDFTVFLSRTNSGVQIVDRSQTQTSEDEQKDL